MGVYDYALACERKEGFENIVFQVRRRLLQFIKKECGWGVRMMNEGESEFADAVEPVGMCDPLDVEFLADVDVRAEGRSGLVELVEDDAVVDPADPGLFLSDRMDIE